MLRALSVNERDGGREGDKRAAHPPPSPERKHDAPARSRHVSARPGRVKAVRAQHNRVSKKQQR
eukprot:1409190-Alexandrium_andersonii.AAC.1